MKGSIALVIGGVAAVGVVAFVIYKRLQSQTKKQAEQNPSPLKRDEPVVSDFAEAKEDASVSIKGRHAEAAQVINNSLQTIFNEEQIEETKSENSDLLDKLDDDLDDLLK